MVFAYAYSYTFLLEAVLGNRPPVRSVMATSYISGETLDDVMHDVIKEIQSNGEHIEPSEGPCSEVRGVTLEITDPRARLSRTETRGKPFSCLGELCWYLAGSNALDFIKYYVKDYKKYADGNIVHGGYGPRLLNRDGLDQLVSVTTLLSRKPVSRQAVVQLFDACDIVKEYKSVPCTCTMQFMIRGDQMHMITYMRSNDVFLGLPHDTFAFTMIQEIMARALSVELGAYKHVVGSLHLYDRDREVAQQFLDEGWQSTKMPMPPMPLGDPWPAIKLLLEAEATLRAGEHPDSVDLKGLDSYWADLIRLLQVFRCLKDENAKCMEQVRQRMASPIYDTFIEKKYKGIQKTPSDS
jgi:thymidylate synthase